MTEHTLSFINVLSSSGVPDNLATMTDFRSPFSFSGGLNEHVDIFVSDFSAYVDLLNLPTEHRKFFLRLSLSGPALNWFRSQLDQLSYAEIKLGLISRFSPANKTLSGIRAISALCLAGQ